MIGHQKQEEFSGACVLTHMSFFISLVELDEFCYIQVPEQFKCLIFNI